MRFTEPNPGRRFRGKGERGGPTAGHRGSGGAERGTDRAGPGRQRPAERHRDRHREPGEREREAAGDMADFSIDQSSLPAVNTGRNRSLSPV